MARKKTFRKKRKYKHTNNNNNNKRTSKKNYKKTYKKTYKKRRTMKGGWPGQNFLKEVVGNDVYREGATLAGNTASREFSTFKAAATSATSPKFVKVVQERTKAVLENKDNRDRLTTSVLATGEYVKKQLSLAITELNKKISEADARAETATAIERAAIIEEEKNLKYITDTQLELETLNAISETEALAKAKEEAAKAEEEEAKNAITEILNKTLADAKAKLEQAKTRKASASKERVTANKESRDLREQLTTEQQNANQIPQGMQKAIPVGKPYFNPYPPATGILYPEESRV